MSSCCTGLSWVWTCFDFSRPAPPPARPTAAAVPSVAPELRQLVPKAFPRPVDIAEEEQPLAPSSELVSRNPVRLVDIELDQELVYLLLTATSQRALGELRPTFLNHYLDHPTLGEDRHWSPAARATRALRAGVSARRVLTGAFHKQARSLNLTVPNNFYVVLWSRSHPGGFWTSRYQVFVELVCAPTGLSSGCICHGFPSVIEVEIFLRGARRQWPPELVAVPQP